ncbi:unnamed protein product [Prorocentrum cordatum]|uniref:RanBP2-type domain-containing protein n=1 Tax=Prorocentrum cordatum TaxID=2364126 RepID=A0ABN9X4D0_9DINO|nr:unnamed protein product [Polarella glacialis]
MPAWSAPNRAGGGGYGGSGSGSASSGNSREWKMDPSGRWHYIGPGNAQGNRGHDASVQQQSRTWQCSRCHSTNHSPKACSVCGLRRSYAAVAASADPAASAPPPKPSTRAQLDQIAQSLQSTLADVQARVAAPRAGAPAAPPDAAAPASAPTRPELVKRLKRYEAALEIYKDDTADPEHARLTQQISDVKAEISALKPLGAKLDGARQALQRASARREEADKALAAAALLRDTAEAEEASAKEAVAALESQVSPLDNTDLMTSIQAQLHQLIGTLKSDPGVHATHIANAEKHVHDLFAGFQSVFPHAKDYHAHQEKVAGLAEGRPPYRHVGKHPLPTSLPEPSVPSHRVRQNGKQPPKEVPDDVFRRPRTRQVASASAKTLDPAGVRRAKKLGLNTSSKMEYLDGALAAAGYNIIGVQESCVGGDVTREQTQYVVYTSGATPEGHFGVESWMARSLVLGARVQPQAISPRLLVVRLDSSQCSFTHVVAHAPVQQASDADRSAFWDSLKAALHAIPPARMVFLSIDGNATLGSIPSSAIPFPDGTAEHNNGRCLREAMEEAVLVLSSMATPEVLPTWFGGLVQHEGRRNDYVAASMDVAGHFAQAGVDHSVHLSGKDSIDHLLTYAEFLVPCPARGGKQCHRPASARLSRSLIADPERQLRFQRYLWERLARVLAGPADPEALHDRVVALMRDCDTSVADHASPRSPGAPAADAHVSMGVVVPRYTTGSAAFFLETLYVFSPMPAAIRAHRKQVKQSISQDFDFWAASIAVEAEQAAAIHDSGALHALARRLRTGHDRPHRAVKDASGNLLTDDLGIDQRWTEHWCQHLAGSTPPFSELLVADSAESVAPDVPRAPPLSLDYVESLLRVSKGRKATGPDGVGPAVRKAGGEPAALLMQAVLNSTRAHCKAPALMKGGRMQDLWKRKGERTDTANSRGLLIQTHAGKVHGATLKDAIEPHYPRAVADTQRGAIAGRGTAAAGLTAELHADMCRSRRQCFVRLFVDLTAAFDTICRELAMVQPTDDPDRVRAALSGADFPMAVQEQVTEFIQTHGNLLRAAGVPADAAALVADMHTNTWLTVQKGVMKPDAMVVRTTKGARQGCKIGALIFNVIYEYALKKVRQRARDAGLVLLVEAAAGQCPWRISPEALPASPTAAPYPGVSADLFDIAFVDDVLFMLMCASPALASMQASMLLEIVIDAFAECGLQCNLKEGKTEVSLHLVGKESRRVRSSLYDPELKRHMLRTPDASRAVSVTNRYKHVGTATSCLQAYYPLAHRVYGNYDIDLRTRLSLADSLCFSKLWFGTETWLNPSPDAVRHLHSARMRVLRQVANRCRFKRSGHGSGREVLRELHVLPTDLILLQKRLVAAATTYARGPAILRALRLQPGTTASAALADDLRWAWQAAPALHGMPDPCTEPAASVLLHS